MLVLGYICLIIALVIVVVAMFVQENVRRKWMLFGLGYAGGAMGLFVLRWILLGFEKLAKTANHRTQES